MVSALARVALGLMVTHCFAQDRFVAKIPTQESAALKAIVEDTAPAPVLAKGDEDDWESPVYTQVYGKALPIPPVKQPKK